MENNFLIGAGKFTLHLKIQVRLRKSQEPRIREPSPLTALNTQLQQDDFPLFLVAEWEQADRLLMLFQKSTDNIERQTTILKLLGTLASDQSLRSPQASAHQPRPDTDGTIGPWATRRKGYPCLGFVFWNPPQTQTTD